MARALRARLTRICIVWELDGDGLAAAQCKRVAWHAALFQWPMHVARRAVAPPPCAMKLHSCTPLRADFCTAKEGVLVARAHFFVRYCACDTTEGPLAPASGPRSTAVQGSKDFQSFRARTKNFQSL